ncbi:MAG: hypothetical protein HKN29_16455, partial [Rhodothermales bacterium]|nr:hypothetical protein [Rhodothermales bacterium]
MTTSLAFVLLVVGWHPAFGQVAVQVASVSAETGVEIVVPVEITNVEGGPAITSFQLEIDAPLGVELVEARSAGTLVEDFTVSWNSENGRIGGFTSSSNAVTSSGVLLRLVVRALTEGPHQVRLVEMSLNAGHPAIQPEVPTFAVITGTGGGAPQIRTEFSWTVPLSDDPNRPYLPGHSGARTVAGPFDLDGDGRSEVLLSDYSGGTRVHVMENSGVDTWEWVYSTPILDEYSGSLNGRVISGGDMDGDGKGEIVFLSGFNFAAGSPYPVGMYVFEAQGNNEFGSAPTAIFDFQPNVPNRWRAEQMHVVDVDRAGLDEVLFGNNGNNANDEWFVIGVTGDIGSGVETFNIEARVNSRTPVNRGGGSPYGIVPADLDGDGNTEISMMSWNNFNFTNMRATGPDTYEIPADGSPN